MSQVIKGDNRFHSKLKRISPNRNISYDGIDFIKIYKKVNIYSKRKVNDSFRLCSRC